MANGKKLNILLDLDQTIISAEPTEDFDFTDSKVKKFKWHVMDDYYIIFERPGLQKFLNFLFKNFNVSVWTAATKDYALFIIDKIILAKKPGRVLDYVFFSNHCDKAKKEMGCTKKLDMLWDYYKIADYNAQNTVILDDYYEEVYIKQKDGCMVVPLFEYTNDKSPEDAFLETAIVDLRSLLKNKDKSKTLEKINARNIAKYELGK